MKTLEVTISIRALKEDDIPSVLFLEDTYLTDPSMCLRSSVDDVDKCIWSGLSIGIFCDNKLVAYCLCYDSDYSIGFIEKCFVSPDWRGRNLQHRLLELSMSIMRRRGLLNIYSMVSPDNVWSMRNFNNVGFKVFDKKEFEGYKRVILKW